MPFELDDMQRLLPALSQAADGLRRLPKQVSQSMRRSLQLNIMNMAVWQSLCVLAQIVCFIAEEELSFHLLFADYDRKEGGDYRHDDAELVAPTEIEDPMPTLNLSMVKHVFHIEADGISFVVAVDGTKVTARRV